MKYVLTLILMSVSFCVCAQDITSIRDSYNNIKEDIRMQEDVENMKNNCVISTTHNVPGIGIQKVRQVIYFSSCENDENGMPKPHKIRYAECSYNIAARNFYEEFLYDDKGLPIFIYCNEPDIDNPSNKIEKRMYFHNGRLLKIKLEEISPREKKVIYKSEDENDFTRTDVGELYEKALKIKNNFAAINHSLQ